jgi:transposase InsO family protein
MLGVTIKRGDDECVPCVLSDGLMVRSFLRNGGKHNGTSSSRERGDHARGQSSNTAIAGFARAVEQRAGHRSEDCREVAQAREGKGFKTGPKEPRSTILTEEEEATIVAFRRHTLLPLDDCLYALQPSIQHLARSTIHRCLQRHGISCLPDVADDKPKRQQFKRYPIGFFHIDIAEVQTVEGNLYLFVGIDRTSKFAVTQLMDKADRKTAREFLEHLLKTVPYRIHKILTDNGIQFADLPRNRNTASSRQMRLDMMCEPNGIKHRLTKPNHPWTNGQVERMNRTIKDATIKRFHYDSHDQLRTRLADFLAADNFARGLKTLSYLTPYEYIRKI